MKWNDKLIETLATQTKREPLVQDAVVRKATGVMPGIHLAVFRKPFLSLIFSGEKTMESRFSVNKVIPYGKVKQGDLIIVKQAGGAVMGVFFAGPVTFMKNLKPDQVGDILRRFDSALCTWCDPQFWTSRQKASYATLISIKNAKALPPFDADKTDRRGWVVLRPSVVSSLFEGEN